MRKSSSARKKKLCPFKTEGVTVIDYKDIDLLSSFITERGKILSRRITGVAAYYQEELCGAIRRARYMALLPCVDEEW